MSAAAEVQALLRFLSKDAKLPLATAMSRVHELRKAELATPDKIASSKLERLQSVFYDEKTAKQVLNAAKRASKKRPAPDTPTSPSTSNKKKKTLQNENTAEDLELSLALPDLVTDEVELSKAVIHTNRAPLVLAFAVILLNHTMPEQPLSSRLSLAQAVVSANSRSKAVSIGLESGKSAEEEGWGAGQPVVKVMGREIRVMKRWGYEWKKPLAGDSAGTQQSSITLRADDEEDDAVLRERPDGEGEEQPALWGVDLEALKRSSSSDHAQRNAPVGFSSTLPIYTPQSARAYLLKSFDSPPATRPTHESSPSQGKKKLPQSASQKQAEKERNLGFLLGALDLVFKSWADTLDTVELDRRAWNWYVRVRPEVKDGVSGWGGKGDVRLADILALRKD